MEKTNYGILVAGAAMVAFLYLYTKNGYPTQNTQETASQTTPVAKSEEVGGITIPLSEVSVEKVIDPALDLEKSDAKHIYTKIPDTYQGIVNNPAAGNGLACGDGGACDWGNLDQRIAEMHRWESLGYTIDHYAPKNPLTGAPL